MGALTYGGGDQNRHHKSCILRILFSLVMVKTKNASFPYWKLTALYPALSLTAGAVVCLCLDVMFSLGNSSTWELACVGAGNSGLIGLTLVVYIWQASETL